jgi:hypothetical protein
VKKLVSILILIITVLSISFSCFAYENVYIRNEWTGGYVSHMNASDGGQAIIITSAQKQYAPQWTFTNSYSNILPGSTLVYIDHASGLDLGLFANWNKNVTLNFDRSDPFNFLWKVTYRGNGYYSIDSTVGGSLTCSSTNLSQLTVQPYTETHYQLFRFYMNQSDLNWQYIDDIMFNPW